MKTGEVVRSTAGRDRGRLLVVVGLEQGRALVADGKVRKLAGPKRKNPLHLQPTGFRLELCQLTTDRALRRQLNQMKDGAFPHKAGPGPAQALPPAGRGQP